MRINTLHYLLGLMYKKWGKSLLDALIAFLLLLVFSPIFLFLIVLLFVFFKGKPFFLQQRPGYNEKLFVLIKFRTMKATFDSNGTLQPDEQRLTGLGKFLRNTSLDELPQLINVLMGQMSLVGPRPLMPEYLPYYTPQQRLRHKVKPGISGWAQVNGRNAISWNDKFQLDIWYVQHISLKTDIIIVLKTINKVFNTKGVSAPGHATMPKFSDEVKYKQTA